MKLFVLIGVNALGLYLALGFIFALAFLWKGVDKVDPGAQDSSRWFKALIFPGICAFWPVLLSKWIKLNRS